MSLIFVAAMVLAAVAGYWFGEVRQQAVGTESGELRTRADRERIVVPRVPDLAPVKLVREAVKGALDDRQQWQQVRWLTEEEVKAAIAELGNAGGYFTRNSELSEMLFYRWGQLNPVAASATAKEMFPRNFSPQRQAVITTWIKQGGGVSAWDAVRNEREMWDCTRSIPGEVAEMLVASLSDRDDAAAFREVLRLNDENCLVADLLCRARAAKASATDESRGAFLAAASTHPDPYILDCAYERLFKEWAKADGESALAGVMALPSPERRQQLQALVESVERQRNLDAERAAAEEP